MDPRRSATNRGAGLRYSQKQGGNRSRTAETDAETAGRQKRGRGDLEICRLRSRIHHSALPGGQRQAGTGSVSATLASGVDLQTLEVHCPGRTSSKTRRTKQPGLALWQVAGCPAQSENGPGGKNHFPLGLSVAANAPLPVHGVNFNLHSIRSPLQSRLQCGSKQPCANGTK